MTKNLTSNAEREKLASWMISNGFSTGHGDSIEDLLEELTFEIKERITLRVLDEQNRCARLCEEKHSDGSYKNNTPHKCAAAILWKKLK